jgi:hypothetical protein
MKRMHILISGTVVITAVAATVFAQRRAYEAPRGAYDQAVLQSQVQRLEARIAKLEAEVRALQAQRGVAPPRTPPERAPEWRVEPAPRAPGQPLPPGWQRREFNGVPYYIIPCEEAGAAPPPVK